MGVVGDRVVRVMWDNLVECAVVVGYGYQYRGPPLYHMVYMYVQGTGLLWATGCVQVEDRKLIKVN